MISFTVLGRPQPAGSKRAFPFRKKNGQLGVAVSDMNPKGKLHRESIADAAVEAANGESFSEGPVVLSCRFYFRYPKKYLRTGKFAGVVRDNAPLHPTSPPDATKCLRHVEDSLNGVLWRDDSQVVIQHATKLYGWPERTEVYVSTLEEAFRHETL